MRLWNLIRGRASKQETPVNESAPCPAATKPARARSGLSLFHGGPHGGLCKLIKSAPARSVLEISVGDGSRAIAVMQTISRNQENVRYLAIDQFEMGGGPVTLKKFHQTLRAANICPQLFPEPIDRGLIRVARTVGTVDLILIAAPSDHWNTPTTLHLLSRVSQPNTEVLYLEQDNWKSWEPSGATDLRRAA